ncbi:hypothetical protein [Bradyrhizobium sp. 160]|uniref:hypothetical protein n=1 Tax=Bradyrhizobium sp. 160 TaxID=2782634 RepID=UPI001FF76149|nr:hypothetical protein [Bradyrhizobium sp. 160]
MTPVPGSERWPLGYRILGERFFSTPDGFRGALQSMIEQHMLESPAHDLPIRFHRDLQYKAGSRYFHLRSRNMEHRVLDDIAPISVGRLIADGNCTLSELVIQVAADGKTLLEVADLLDQLYMAGLIEEDLDDRFIWQTGDWTTSRVQGVKHAGSRTGADCADSH